MRRGDGPILFALLGVGFVTVGVRPPGGPQSPREDVGREVATATARSALEPPPASPIAAASSVPACPHERPLAAPSGARAADAVPAFADAFGTPSSSSAATPATPTAGAPLVEMLGTPIIGTPTISGLHDRDLGGPFVPDGRPTLVALAASWCRPCADELPILIGLGAALHAALDARVVLVMNDTIGGPHGLAAAVDSLWALAEPTSRTRPAWLELRADPDAKWAQAIGDRDGELPRTLLLDGRGVVRARVDGPLAEAHAERLGAIATHLAEAGL